MGVQNATNNMMSQGNTTGMPDLINYDQKDVPNNPKQGEIWRERDANNIPVVTWVYNASAARWESFTVYSGDVCGTSSLLVSTTTIKVPLGVKFASTGVVLLETNVIITTPTDHTSVNYWTASCQGHTGNALIPIAESPTLDTKMLKANKPLNLVTTPNKYFNLASTNLATWAVVLSKVNTLVANINYSASFYVKRVR